MYNIFKKGNINNYLILFFLLVIIFSIIYYVYLSQEISKNIETFVNNSSNITFDLYTKLDNNGNYNNLSNIGIVSSIFLKKDGSDFINLNSSENDYLNNITGKKKVAIKTTGKVGGFFKNKYNMITKSDNNNLSNSFDNIYLINNNSAGDNNNIEFKDGYYQFTFTGKQRHHHKKKIGYNYVVDLPKSVKNLQIKSKEKNDNINNEWKKYEVSGFVKGGSDYIYFEPTKGETLEIILKLTEPLNHVEAFLFSSYTNHNVKHMESKKEVITYYTYKKKKKHPWSTKKHKVRVKHTKDMYVYIFLLNHHFSYNMNFDMVPVKGPNFYTMMDEPDYGNNHIFTSLNDSYGENLYDDDKYLNYYPNLKNGLMRNQKEDYIGGDKNNPNQLGILQNGGEYKPGLIWREYATRNKNHPTTADELAKKPNRHKKKGHGVTSNVKNFSRNKNNYFVDFKGFFKPTQSGYYRFGISCDDAGDLYINNTRVAYWYGGHGSNGTSKPGGTSEECMYLEAEKYYRLYARYEEHKGGDNITLLYKFFEDQNNCNIDTSYLNQMDAIPSEMLFYKDNNYPVFGLDFISNLFKTSTNPFTHMASNNMEDETVLGDKYNSNLSINFRKHGDINTHNYKLSYNYNNNIVLDNNICVLQIEFENYTSLNTFNSHLKNIFISSNYVINDNNIIYTKEFSPGDAKYILYVLNSEFPETSIDTWISEILGVSYYNEKYYLIKGYEYE